MYLKFHDTLIITFAHKIAFTCPVGNFNGEFVLEITLPWAWWW
jgi:hypothetical protein